MRLVRLLLFSPLLACGSTPLAHAGIIFCNQFAHLVYIAIAYPQTGDDWLSRGWMSLDTGQCAPFDTALSTKTFYYRAESEEYRNNGKHVTWNWGDKGDRKFAIWESDNFQYYGAQNRVLKSTLKPFEPGMSDADVYDVTVTLTEDGGATEHGVRKQQD
jgi:uncharacterized membrane protein